MTVKRQGSMTGSTTISQAGSVLTISAEGVAQITARIKTDTTNILTALNSIPPGTPHPTFTTLLSREYGAVTNVGGIDILIRFHLLSGRWQHRQARNQSAQTRTGMS
jgi:hypothetical protein